MDRFIPFIAVAALVLLNALLLIGAFRLYSAWNARTIAARQQNPEVESLGIGGLLWFPALWTVTDLLTPFMVIKQSPEIGYALLIFSLPNFVLFWLRNWAYPHFFLAKTALTLYLMFSVYGASGGGAGAVFALIVIPYLYASKRSRKTFIYRLNGSIKQG